jgi:hypothetical protein
LLKYITFEFLKDILSEIEEFKNYKASFISKAEHWIEKTLLEVYAERNLETHNDIMTDLSLIKLRDCYISVANTLIQVIYRNLNSKVSSISEIESKI